MRESREFKLGVYRDPITRDRHEVRVRLRDDLETGDRFVSLQGLVYRAHSSHPYAAGQTYDEYLPADIRAFWQRWHLSDMRAACEHQRTRGETWATHPSAVCPDCGYRLGSAWLREPLDGEAVAWLARKGLQFPE